MKTLIAVLAAIAFASGTQNAWAEVEHLGSGKGGLPFSEAVRVGSTLYLSGQVGLDRETGTLVSGGIEAESRQTMQNIQSTLRAHGYAMRDVVKCTVFLADMAEWSTFNRIYEGYFSKEHYPARSAVSVNGLAMSARVEVECIASR